MGVASATKFIINKAGTLTEKAALTSSAGAADKDALVALNAKGVLDKTIINGTDNPAGSADAGKTLLLDASGRISSTAMPVGMGADTASITASEALAAGDLVNVWSDGGAFKVRKADASAAGKEAHGFVLAAVSAGAAATVYFEGTNTQMTGLTPGALFLSATAGKAQASAPTGAGQVVQRVGFAVSATALNFQASQPVVLA